jgi:methionyl aminopeptidase
MGVILDGFYSDQAFTYGVGEIDEEAQRLLSTTSLALDAAIMQAKPGNHIGDISAAMQQVTELAGFNVIRDMVGHGIGQELHEDPQIPCYGEPGRGELIKEGMVLAIEAMVNEGSSELAWGDDKWTTYTYDGMRSAIFEHTVAVSARGAEILTIK